MTNAPLVSVIMPVYNAAHYLPEAIESILNQTFSDFEFVIINDGSADESAEILDHYRQRDTRINIYQQENKGVTASLNRGLSLARGKHIARQDADDVSLPERFEKQVDYLKHNLQIGVVGCAINLINGQGRIIGSNSFQTNPDLLEWVLLFGSPLAHPSVMMRTEIVNKIGGYSMKYATAQDYDLWGRLSKHTKFANLSEHLVCYRVHADAISIKSKTKQDDASRLIQKSLLAEYISMEDSEFLVNVLHSGKYTEPQAIHTAELIYTLYSKFERNHHLSWTSKRILRYSVGHKIHKTIKPTEYSLSALIWFIKAFILAPSIIFRS